MKKILFAATILLAVACTNNQKTEEIIEANYMIYGDSTMTDERVITGAELMGILESNHSAQAKVICTISEVCSKKD